MKKVIPFIVFLCFFTSRLTATIVYVDSANTSGIQDGHSWATAFTNFQTGINTANTGDSVWVAKGTYQPTQGISYTMKSNVKIFGGFVNTAITFAQRNWQTNLTRLKGNNNSVIRNDLTNLNAAAVLDGFTISNGKTSNIGGGAIYNYYASPTITNCTFTLDSAYNNPTRGGGAIYNESSSPTIINCIFSNNFAAPAYDGAFGGAIYNYNATVVITSCTFSNNRADCNYSNGNNYLNGIGGAIYNLESSLTIDNCTFSGNIAITTVNNGNSSSCGGGAIYSTNQYSNKAILNITNCTFQNNLAKPYDPAYSSSGYAGSSSGGAIYNGYKAVANISNCNFSMNTAYGSKYLDSYGGGIMNNGPKFKLSNCTFTQNNAKTYASGVYISPSINDTSTITNCTFSMNRKSEYGGGIYISTSTTSSLAIIKNCIFWADSARYAGGGAYHYRDSRASFINCLFAKCITDSVGAGIYSFQAFPKLVNCTFACNKAVQGGGAVYNYSNSIANLSNTIIWGNSSGIFNDASSLTSVSYSLIQGIGANTTYSLLDGNTNPLFEDTLTGNYQLQPSSPCLNQGRNDSIPSGTTKDLAGNARIYNNVVDMGAYEYIVVPPVVRLGNDTAVCTAPVFILDAGNPGATYLWNTGATTRTIAVTNTGTYNVKATNIEGESKDTIQVVVNTNPTVNLGNDTAICAGKSIVLNAQNNGATYRWNNNLTTQVISINTSGTYSVTVTDANKCSNSDAMILTINPLPIVKLGNDTGICKGNTVVLDAKNPGNTYTWNNSAITQTITVDSGTFSVTVTDANKCSSSDTIHVTMYPLPIVNLGKDTSFCSGASLILDAQNAGATYIWNNASSNRTLSVSASGTYNIKVTNVNKCVASDTIQITVNPLPVVNLGNDITRTVGETQTLDAGNPSCTYQWSTGATTQTIDVTISGTYQVDVINSNFCKSSDAIKVTFIPKQTGIDELASDESIILINPNPTKDAVTINIGNNASLLHSTIMLTDISGRVMQTFTLETNTQVLQLASLEPGMYILKLQTGKAIKIIKE